LGDCTLNFLLGTYVRTRAIDRLITSFLISRPHDVKQIISLGAGRDTRYFRLVEEVKSSRFIYHEIDFQMNSAEKIKIIKQTPALLSLISRNPESTDEIQISDENDSLISSTYNIHSLDLRTISPTSKPSIPNLDPNIPTLILSECCLIYLSPAQNTQILETFTQHYVTSPTHLSLLIYEPIRPNDPFGRVMVSNLASRGIFLQTLQKFENLAAQRSRLRNAGFTTVQCAADINFIWENWVNEDEKNRVARCEMFDEVEEWVLLAKHYCIVWGCREAGEVEGIFTAAWKDLPFQDEE
jgi:[phosphatase 2A protein]-leucine-carboxy methyltransferase